MCKLHIDIIIISIWCHVMCFTIKIIRDLFKVTRKIFNHMWHLWLKKLKKYFQVYWNINKLLVIYV